MVTNISRSAIFPVYNDYILMEKHSKSSVCSLILLTFWCQNSTRLSRFFFFFFFLFSFSFHNSLTRGCGWVGGGGGGEQRYP